jgi:hypothetical protein
MQILSMVSSPRTKALLNDDERQASFVFMHNLSIQKRMMMMTTMIFANQNFSL